MKTIRIGAVSYLNTKPLVYGLEQNSYVEKFDYELSFDLPSRLADQLAAGSLDVALIPSVEIQDGADYTVVSDACIACRGPVWSVKFLSRVPLNEVRTVALDEGSRTSAAMTKIMLSELACESTDKAFEIRYSQLPMDADWRKSETDAVLVIGDRAMHLDSTERESKNSESQNSHEFVEVVDMGLWWRDKTGLPFVFAMWATHESISANRLNQISELLTSSRDLGVARINEISQSNAQQYGLTESQCVRYLGENLHFMLGEQEKIALNKFYDKTTNLGLTRSDRTIRFHDYQTVR